MSDINEQRKYYERMMDEIAVEHGRQICELMQENARLVDVLHEVRDEATSSGRENASLRELVRRMLYAVHPLDREKFLTNVAELGVEVDDTNAKLRELVRHMYECIERLDRTDEDRGCILCPYQKVEYNCEFKQRMRELGMEVEG